MPDPFASLAQPIPVTVTRTPDRALHTDASAEMVGRVALSAGIPLLELRASDSAGLEEMFLQLTADDVEYHSGRLPGDRATRVPVPEGAAR